MSDLISRQAAIDRAVSIPMFGRDVKMVAVSEIKNLPSAQPETDEWCTDCKEYDKKRHCCPRWNRVIRETLKDAQPDIVRCKDCKHFHYDMPYLIQGVPILGHEVCDFWGDGCRTDENGFCSYAERREE